MVAPPLALIPVENDPTATFCMRCVQLSYGAFLDCPAQPRRLSWQRALLPPSIVQTICCSESSKIDGFTRSGEVIALTG